jgi:hypothetical protein
MSAHHAPSRDASRAGGRAKTSAKTDALALTHSRRKGVRVNISAGRLRENTLAELHTLVTQSYRAGSISIRRLARDIRVSDRSVRRWLDGKNWPSTITLRAIASWMRAKKHASGVDS